MVVGNDYVTPFAILTFAVYGLKPYSAEDLVSDFFTESTSTQAFLAQSLLDSSFISIESTTTRPFLCELLSESSFNSQESSAITPFEVGCFS